MAGPPFTIDTTSPAPSDLVSQFPSNEQADRTVINDWLTFLSDPTTGVINTAALPSEALGFPSGTTMLFYQAAAPTGWTKSTAHDNKALRVVSGAGGGSGGTVAFTTAFASARSVSGTVGDHALTAAEMPAHTHSSGTFAAASHSHSNGTLTAASAGSHTHGYYITRAYDAPGVNTPYIGGGQASLRTSTSGEIQSGGAHTHDITGSTSASGSLGVSGTSGSAGSGGTHTHTWSGNVNVEVQYVDMIICTKD